MKKVLLILLITLVFYCSLQTFVSIKRRYLELLRLEKAAISVCMEKAAFIQVGDSLVDVEKLFNRDGGLGPQFFIESIEDKDLIVRDYRYVLNDCYFGARGEVKVNLDIQYDGLAGHSGDKIIKISTPLYWSKYHRLSNEVAYV